MKCFVIFNPGSKDGKSKKKIQKIIRFLEEENIKFEYKITEKLEDAYLFSREANLNYFDIIIAVGGDGTINNVINGFYDQKGSRISNALFGVIYTGTSPDFCKSNNIPVNIKNAVKTIKERNSKLIKLGKITFVNIENSFQNINKINKDVLFVRYFACCANFGLGAMLAKNANSGIRKYLGDFLGTFFSLIKTLFVYKPDNFEIIIDNRKRKIENLFNLSIGKTFFVASGIKVNNDLTGSDKNFYVLEIKKIDLLNILPVIINIYSGQKIKNSDYINLSYCNQIEIINNRNNPNIEFDGDPRGCLPCKIEEAKDPLRVITRMSN